MSMTNNLRGQTTVQIGDDTHDVLLNMNAFRLMCQARDMELAALDEFVNANPLEFVPTVVFWGMMNAADFAGTHVLTFHLTASPRSCVRTWNSSPNCPTPSERPSGPPQRTQSRETDGRGWERSRPLNPPNMGGFVPPRVGPRFAPT